MPSDVTRSPFPPETWDSEEPTGAPRAAVEPRRRPIRAIASVTLVAALLAGLAGGTAGYFAGRDAGMGEPATTVTSMASRASPIFTSDLPGVIAAARKWVVTIDVRTAVTTSRGQMTEDASGTGIVIRPDGMIATNAHVIEGAREIMVTLSDGTTMSAKVVNRDRSRDLAVLQVERTGLAAAEFGDSEALRAGDAIVAIGNALALGNEPTATSGIVSGLNRAVSTQTSPSLTHMLQVDAAINSGNSGGPLIDWAGRVVGINTASSTSAENIGFAIPIADALPILLGLMADDP